MVCSLAAINREYSETIQMGYFFILLKSLELGK